MTARAGRRRNGSSGARLAAVGALALVAFLAPGLFEQAATSGGQLLGSLAGALAELLHQTVVQPLIDGLAESAESTSGPPAPP